ncbi:ABC transporter ATP-binding protein [Brachybacterium sp. YJGR34]|uniref:ABC transporter ATP-binding protein n=1 Tax=Brachybacterium sp. YJGR34 TaxID=2059911 RepID=UPI000E0C39B4|nr:ABC transporter ATP-binding protein [Brachybacterium sp. YJGR34]
MSLTMHATVPERGLDVALEVAEGQTLSLVGPNGAGKSTILDLIAGTLRPATGRIALDAQVLTEGRTLVPPHARSITTLSQDPALFPHLTAAGNIGFALRSRGVPRRRARLETRRRLAEAGLEQLADRRPAQLSGGQAQRVAIARALAASPRLLLLDEPMAALDIDVAPALRELLRRVLAERTAIVVSHDALDAVTLADRIAVLEEGRIIESGPTAEVLARPRTAFAARFAGLNLLHGSWDGDGVRLPGGELVPATPWQPVRPGTPMSLALRPSAVAVAGSLPGPAADGPRPGPGRPTMRRRIRSLEPLGDLVRVRTDDLAADLEPQRIAALRLRPGTEIDLVVRGRDAVAYPAR